jgi:hypothetical protein
MYAYPNLIVAMVGRVGLRQLCTLASSSTMYVLGSRSGNGRVDTFIHSPPRRESTSPRSTTRAGVSCITPITQHPKDQTLPSAWWSAGTEQVHSPTVLHTVLHRTDTTVGNTAITTQVPRARIPTMSGLKTSKIRPFILRKQPKTTNRTPDPSPSPSA